MLRKYTEINSKDATKRMSLALLFFAIFSMISFQAASNFVEFPHIIYLTESSVPDTLYDFEVEDDDKSNFTKFICSLSVFIAFINLETEVDKISYRYFIIDYNHTSDQTRAPPLF